MGRELHPQRGLRSELFAAGNRQRETKERSATAICLYFVFKGLLGAAGLACNYLEPTYRKHSQHEAAVDLHVCFQNLCAE